jgi:hypothetical protein
MSGAGLSLRSKSRRRLRVPFNPTIFGATPQVFNSGSTSMTIVLPARNVGDRLIIAICRKSSDGGDAIAPPAGCTALSTSGLTGCASCFSRAYVLDVTNANVGDASALFSGGANVPSCSLVWRLTGCDLTVAPVANGTVQNSNGITTLDPAALTGPNSGASQRNLWLAYLAVSLEDSANGATPTVTGWPAGYGNTGTSTNTSASTTNGCGQGWASKIATAGSDDPSAWSFLPNFPGGRAFAINIAVRGVQA